LGMVFGFQTPSQKVFGALGNMYNISDLFWFIQNDMFLCGVN
jgi:hypothetical protein